MAPAVGSLGWMQRLRRSAAALAGAVAVAASGCGGSSGASATRDPRALLRAAKATIDRTPSLHFVLTSTGATGSGTIITGGEGDIARPDQLEGSFTVEQSGLGASVGVMAGGGRFYVKLPFSSSYAATNPSTYGIGDPAQLIDPARGLSRLLLAISQPRLAGTTRIGSEVADQVEGTVPGASVPVLPDADRAAPVTVVAAVVPGSDQLRRLTLRGPFTSTSPSTYIVALTRYGEAVHITLPGG